MQCTHASRIVSSRSFVIAALGVVLAQNSPAQHYKLSVQLPAGDQFGAALGACGDVNGDGVEDLIVGAPQPAQPSESGYASIVSGADGSLIRQIMGREPGGWFGISVAGIGDVNGDGTPDMAVGAFSQRAHVESERSGYVDVVSGADSTLLYTATPASSLGLQFGYRLSAVGDVNGDSVPDFAVAVPTAVLTSEVRIGAVEIRSGADGVVIHTLQSGVEDDGFGEYIATVPDLDGDGVSELVVGAPLPLDAYEGKGGVYVFSGASAEQLWAAHGGSNRGCFGSAVHAVQDMNGDGKADIMVAEFGPFELDSRSAYVLSGADGNELMAIPKSAGFGPANAVAGMDDLDADGKPELICADYTAQPPTVRAYSGASPGTVVYEKQSSTTRGKFGAAVCTVGDVNGDGIRDLAVSDYLYKDGGATGGGPARSGRVFMMSGKDGALLYEVVAH